MKLERALEITLLSTAVLITGCGVKQVINPDNPKTRLVEKKVPKKDLNDIIQTIDNMSYLTGREILAKNWFLAKTYAAMGDCLFEEMYNQYNDAQIKEYEKELEFARQQFERAKSQK